MLYNQSMRGKPSLTVLTGTGVVILYVDNGDKIGSIQDTRDNGQHTPPEIIVCSFQLTPYASSGSLTSKSMF